MCKLNIINITSLILMLFFYSCQSQQSTEQTDDLGKLQFEKKALYVDAIAICESVFVKEILCNGVVTPRKKAKLVFKANENILNVYVKNGQWVNQGEILARLDDYNQKLSLEKAKNSLLKSEIELKDILFAHSPDLSDISKINPEVLETARGRSGFNNALSALKESEYSLSHTILKAPFDGVVSDIQVKENNYSGSYEYFAYILDNRQMELEFSVMESELSMINKGVKVIFTPYAFPGKNFSGEIDEINPIVDESGMIKIKAKVPNANAILLDGMNVEVIVKKEIPNQLVVPKQAVLLRQERQVVFTLKNDSIAQWVYVKTGLENSNEYTITEGLSNGDTVIISNNFNLGHEVIVKADIN